MQFGNLTLKQCKYGWMLFSGPYIGKCFELYGQYSESEVAMMGAFVKDGCTAIDVGANIGDLTLPLARMAGDSGRIYAIESNPAAFNILCANLALNAIENVKPINAFVATGPDADTANKAWGQFVNIGARWEPQFMALDALDLPRCDLIKVDVDGKELEVLRSGEMLVERHRPVLYFENDVRSASADLLGFCMDDLGYDLYWHPAPIFETDNFAGNPVNHWMPETIVSMMMLGLPRERNVKFSRLQRVTEKNEWPYP